MDSSGDPSQPDSYFAANYFLVGKVSDNEEDMIMHS